MKADSRNDAGFTLVEVLMAGAVLAMVAALLLPVIRIAGQAENRSREQSELRNNHARLEAVMRELLWQAQEAPGGLDAQRFSGEPGSVSFLTRPSGQAGLYQASLEVEGGGLVVTLSQFPDGQAFRSHFPLAANAVRFHFYGDPDGEGVAVWRDNWSDAGMPRLVVLDMTRHDGQLRRIEALVGGRAPVDCEYDSGQGICLGADY